MKTFISTAASFCLITLFIYAGISKLPGFDEFGAQLFRQPLPHWLALGLHYTLIPAELLTAALLYAAPTRRPGLIISGYLMAAFTIYAGLALTGAFGHIPCSCGGILSHLSWNVHFMFNVVFLALSLIALRYHHPENK